MPFRGPREHFEDIQESIENIFAFIDGIDFETYKRDRKTKSDVERELQIITEAAVRLGEDGTRLSPGPDWKSLRGMGNILRHQYHKVDDQTVWNAVMADLPELQASVLRALAEMNDD